ncbi:MAG: plastocyanin/azurin family copper-binding protein [Bacteroidota bacterium]
MKALNKTGKLLIPVLCMGIFMLLQSGCKSPSERMEEPHKGKLFVVEITQMRFSPAEIAVSKGDKIQFINHDMVAHDITEEATKAWSSSPLQPDQAWTLEVTESANYYCSIHPVMKGKITVQP